MSLDESAIAIAIAIYLIIKIGYDVRQKKKLRREWLVTDKRAICLDEEERLPNYKSRFNLCILETLEQSVYSTWKEALQGEVLQHKSRAI